MASGLEEALRDLVDGTGSAEALKAAVRDEGPGGLGDRVEELLDRYEKGDWSEDDLRERARGLIVGA
jgi:hypothetical protein